MRELLGDLPALRAAHAAVDRLHRLRPAEQRPDPAREVVERVAVLGEHDQLAPLLAGSIRGERVVLEDRPQLRPLAIGLRRPDARSGLDQIAQFQQLGLELLDRPRRGRRVDQLLLDLLELLGRELVIVELLEIADGLRGLGLGDRRA